MNKNDFYHQDFEFRILKYYNILQNKKLEIRMYLDRETYKKIHISVKELKEKIDKGEDFILLDVREPQEYAFSRIKEKDAMLVPLMSLPKVINSLPKDKDIYVFCRSGNRSLQATLWLLQNGFTRVKNVEGGILAWSDEIDPTVPKY
jgi:adenylyltransferase/sulfurtransferase